MGVGVTGGRRAVHLTVRGRVQGVGYRWFAARAAMERGIVGWVRNAADGSVELVASGDAAIVDEFIEVLRRGPAHARVDDVAVEDRPSALADDYAEFEIVR